MDGVPRREAEWEGRCWRTQTTETPKPEEKAAEGPAKQLPRFSSAEAGRR